jgi:hypothetical protein
MHSSLEYERRVSAYERINSNIIEIRGESITDQQKQ